MSLKLSLIPKRLFFAIVLYTNMGDVTARENREYFFFKLHYGGHVSFPDQRNGLFVCQGNCPSPQQILEKVNSFFHPCLVLIRFFERIV